MRILIKNSTLFITVRTDFLIFQQTSVFFSIINSNILILIASFYSVIFINKTVKRMFISFQCHFFPNIFINFPYNLQYLQIYTNKSVKIYVLYYFSFFSRILKNYLQGGFSINQFLLSSISSSISLKKSVKILNILALFFVVFH